MADDHVAGILEQWARERPDLDVAPIGVIGRLHRVAQRLTEELVALYAEFGLGEGEFDILATLRRQGPPYALAPRELGAQTMVTSGAITKRVDRCEQAGWVARTVSDQDARGRVVTLTPAGRRLIDEAFAAHVANESRLVATLSPAERRTLARMLGEWDLALRDG